MKSGFRVLPHTSEVGLEIAGRGWASFYRNAAAGLLALYELRPGAPGAAKTSLRLAGETPEDVLVAWLSELIFLIATRKRVPAAIDVIEAGPRALRAAIRGERSKRGPLRLAREIKAAAYHGLTVEKKRGAIRARVLLDV